MAITVQAKNKGGFETPRKRTTAGLKAIPKSDSSEKVISHELPVVSTWVGNPSPQKPTMFHSKKYQKIAKISYNVAPPVISWFISPSK